MKFLALLALTCLAGTISCQFTKLSLTRVNSVTVKGIAHTDAENFEINFENDDGMVPLHLSARLSSKWGSEVPYIVLNSNKNINSEPWDTEIRKSTANVLKQGSEFEIKINIEANQFVVYLNGNLFDVLPFRQPISQAKYVSLYGDASVYSVHRTISTNLGSEFGLAIDSFTDIKIKGKIDDFSNGFSYDINNFNDITFHSSFRFGEGALVLNNLKNFAWQAEQRERLAVARGQVFTHKIRKDSSGFTLSLKDPTGKEFSYKFARPGPISGFTVHGQINVSLVTLVNRAQ